MPWSDRLMCAVQYGDSEGVEHLLRRGYPANGKCNVSVTPLLLAVQYNEVDMCKSLIKYGANVNWQTQEHQTPIYFCIDVETSFEIFELLLNAGAKVDTRDIYGRNPLHYAANAVQKKRVHCLLRSRGVRVNDCDFQGFSALHHVLTNCDFETDIEDITIILQMLLNANADVNLQDNRGLTPLHIAISHNYYDVSLSKFLLTSRVNIDFEAKTSDNENFLHFIFEKNLCEENSEQLIRQILHGKLIPKPILKSLLNQRNVHGLTPFCLYLSNPFREDKIFKRLLTLGANVNTADDLGITPLMIACWLDINDAQVLLKHGADAKCRDVFGRSTLYMARNVDTVELLLKHGSDMKTVDNFGRSVLCQNLLVSDLECVEYLIQQGGKINQSDKHMSSPLHYAAYEGRDDLVKVLLRHQANTRLRDEENRTPYETAKIHKRKHLLEILKEKETTTASESSPPVEEYYFSKVYEIIHPDDTTNAKSLQKKLRPHKDIFKASVKALSEQSTLLSSHQEENERVRKGILSLMETIIKRMSEIDNFFTALLLSAGSISEGTKTGNPDEFDFVFCLTKFAVDYEMVEDAESALTGMAKVRYKRTPPPKELSFYLDDCGYILTQNIRFSFSRLLKRILREAATWTGRSMTLNGMSSGSEDMERPALSFSVTWISCRYKNLQINIDTVPAIYIKGWWPSHLKKWKPSLMTKAIGDEGCLLLATVQEERGPEEMDTFNFRVSSFPAENYLLRNFCQEIKNAYILAKILKSNGVCPDIKFRGDGVKTKDHVICPASVITSYMLKNCLFHVLADDALLLSGCQKQSSAKELTNFTVKLTVKILQKLQQLAGKNEMLPAYFLPNQNIMNYEDTYIMVNDMEDVRERTRELATEIDVFCTVLLGCLGIFSA